MYGFETVSRMIVARLSAELDLASSCDWTADDDTQNIGLWSNISPETLAVLQAATTEALDPVPVGYAEVPGVPAVACFASAQCSAMMSVILDLRAVRAAGDVSLTWRADLHANGYNVWTVTGKRQIDDARRGSVTAVGVGDCSDPAPRRVPECLDVEGISRDQLLFYQVRAWCDSVTEGP